MQFEYTHPQTEVERLLGGFHEINAFGPIEDGDDTKFEDFLRRVAPPPRTPIHIDSEGGFVEAALSIGRIIRASWYSTSIGKYILDHDRHREHIIPRMLLPGSCLSAATLMYLGGRLRHFPIGSRFGVHQFSFRNPTPDYIGKSQILSSKIAQYVFDMGISSQFLEISSSTDVIKLIEVDELKELRVVTGGQTDVEWSVQATGMLYVRGERDSIFGHHKVMLGYTKQSGFFVLDRDRGPRSRSRTDWF
ncbi:hypothetical protein ACFX5Q_01000 [Mesorhizobium sp. IMUNJ 23033]|uniref:COG3904 family protein n=1 Tax=Mesorhizobium sp. IMUNJ 23033 TaxID=3378039 RepID=UPI00384BDCF2